jgi:flagellar basal-body rod modification protein FlgD
MFTPGVDPSATAAANAAAGSSAAQRGSGSGSTDRAEQQIADTFDNFLSLLTTQLKNQDPTSPMEATEFTNQLVSFSQVEQQIATNRRLDTLIESQAGGQFGEALDYIGREIEMVGDSFAFGEEPVSMGYGMPAGALLAQVEVVDAAGQVVWSAPAEMSPGRHEITWDGETSNGGDAGPGTYTIRVKAADAGGEMLEVPTFVRGTVTGAEHVDGQTVLLMGSVPIALEDVLAIRTQGNG